MKERTEKRKESGILLHLFSIYDIILLVFVKERTLLEKRWIKRKNYLNQLPY